MLAVINSFECQISKQCVYGHWHTRSVVFRYYRANARFPCTVELNSGIRLLVCRCIMELQVGLGAVESSRIWHTLWAITSIWYQQ